MNGDQLYLCIHCHFYQPPRENPWLEAIEYQDSASPYHDWNERISAECYRPNGLSRILDDDGWVVRLTNNYARISFNFGPTLLSWMEDFDPVTYQAILDGDHQSLQRYGGHGSAIAQAYNHPILPLDSRRDKETQIKWGLYDFEKRFGRAPEAMWMPETAADTETLEVMAGHGLKYVIMAPRQAQSVRNREKGARWIDVKGERVNPRMPYHIELPGGKSIAAFFYDGQVSKAVAFEGLLHNGEGFAHRLMEGFEENDDGPQLLNIATDGESYGHHHRHGDMALAYALDHIEREDMAQIINYGFYLEKYPPQREARIFEKSSWSCVHGVERWRSDCGCQSGMHGIWNQAWRGPLREAFNLLRDRLAGPYEKFMADYTDDPWGIRDDYIRIITDRSDDNRAAFFKRWLNRPVEDETRIWKALEVQRNLLLVYTSCAWFFDEISGLEGTQNLQYAARAIELARDVLGVDVEDDFKAVLEKAPSNIEHFENGRKTYEMAALPAKVGVRKVAAHLAAMTLFLEEESDGSLYCYDFKWGCFMRRYSGRSQMICADLEMISRVTRESHRLELCVVHMGDHNINIGVRHFTDEHSCEETANAFDRAFGRGDIARLVRLLDQHFEEDLLSLSDLFRDQQKNILDIVFAQTLESVADQFVNIYDQHHPVMNYLSDIHIQLPPVFTHIAAFVQNSQISHELAHDEIYVDEITRYIEESKAWGIALDAEQLEQDYLGALERLFAFCREDPADIDALQAFADLVDLLPVLPFEVELGNIQTAYLIWAHNQMNADIAEDPDWQALVARIAGHFMVRLDGNGNGNAADDGDNGDGHDDDG